MTIVSLLVKYSYDGDNSSNTGDDNWEICKAMDHGINGWTPTSIRTLSRVRSTNTNTTINESEECK